VSNPDDLPVLDAAAWSVGVPIAIDYAPCNRSGVWVCRQRHKPFLRHTEYGGHSGGERIRAVASGLVA